METKPAHSHRSKESYNGTKYEVAEEGKGLQIILHYVSKRKDATSFLLPPMAANDIRKKKKTLVLDLDETLVHTSLEPVNWNYDFICEFKLKNSIRYTCYGSKRPGLEQMLQELRGLYEIVVFTASEEEYANAVLDKIDPQGDIIAHRLFREACVVKREKYGKGVSYSKDLSRLGRDLSMVVFADDMYRSHCQPENAFPICSWRGRGENDTTLFKLSHFCRRIAFSASDVRTEIRAYRSSLEEDRD